MMMSHSCFDPGKVGIGTIEIECQRIGNCLHHKKGQK